jgi:hypothetical protein
LTHNPKARNRLILRLSLALALMMILITMTQQETSQAMESEVPEGATCPGGMVAYWKLNETSGSTYADFFQVNDGGCRPGTDTCPTPTSGQIVGAQQFAAANLTGIDVPAFDELDWANTDGFAVEFWVKTPTPPAPPEPNPYCETNEVMIGRDGAWRNLRWWIGCEAGGLAFFYLTDNDGVTFHVRSDTRVNDGEWHHVAVVRDPGPPGRIRIYVDGAFETWTAAEDTGDFWAPNAELNIGWWDISTGEYFTGSIDEVAIYDRSLSHQEVADQYLRTAAGRGYCQEVKVSLIKTASDTIVEEGDTVLYTYELTNDGDENVSSVNLTDDTCAPISLPTGDTGIIGELAIGETWTYTCSQTLYGDTTNTATVTGISATGVELSTTATETVTVTPIHPSVTISKQADQNFVVAGDVVVYSYEAENTGDVELTNLLVTDDQCSPVTGPQGATLAVAETATFTCAQVLTQTTTNTGTATANHKGIGGVVTDDSDPVTVQVAGLSLVKSASAASVEPGETVIYQYAVENTGDVPLSNVVVTDDKCSPVLGPQGTTLAPGQSEVFSCAQELNKTTTNTGTVTTYYGDIQVTAQHSVTVRIDTYYIYLPIVLGQYP